MTRASSAALYGPTSRAIAAVRREHCKPPAYKPDAPVSGHIDCPKCGGRLHFTVAADGYTSGRCPSAACIQWSGQ